MKLVDSVGKLLEDCCELRRRRAAEKAGAVCGWLSALIVVQIW